MGININDAFPSNYLKASDLQGRQVTVEMADIKYEKLGEDDKLVLYFHGKDKGLVLNKTNANNIGAIYGADTDGWIGKSVMLVETLVDFQGRSTPAIRIRAPVKAPGRASSNAPLATGRTFDDRNPPPRDMADLDDEIPF